MKVLNVVVSLDPVSGGGVTERTVRMSLAMVKEGIPCGILTTDFGLTGERVNALAGVEVTAMPCLNKRYFIPWFSFRRLKELVESYDIVHLIGHWNFLNALVWIIARAAGKPYVVCPAGSLPIYGRSGVKKLLYNILLGNRLVRGANGHIAVTPAEIPQFGTYGVGAGRITVIPNGIDPDNFLTADPEGFRKKYSLDDTPFIMFMGRLNHIKGPDLLLEAFNAVKSELKDYHLLFVGPNGGMLEELKRSALMYGVQDRVHFSGFVDDRDKASAYRAADLLVIPSRQEAMSIVVLEAGVSGTPVLITDQCGFNVVGSIGGGLVVPASAEGLAGGLRKLLPDRKGLTEKGAALNKFVREGYLWQAVVRKYSALYSGILNGLQAKAPAPLHKLLLFPLAFALNSFSLQLLIVFAGLSGQSVLAADLSLAQASMLAVFFALSGNARNLIIKSDSSPAFYSSIVKFRVLLAPVLSLVALSLALFISGAGLTLSLLILVRQLSEWFAELELSRREKADDTGFAYAFVWGGGVTLLLALVALLLFPDGFIFALAAWAAVPAILSGGFFREAVRHATSEVPMDWQKILPNCASTIIIGTGVFFFRVLISGFAGKVVAGELFTAYALGGIISSVYERSLGPTLNAAESGGGLRSRLLKFSWLIPAAGLLIVGVYYSGFLERMGFAVGGYLLPATGFSVVGGFLMLRAQVLKIGLLQRKDFNDLFMPDLLSNFLILFAVPVIFLALGSRGFVWFFVLNALFVYICYFLVSKTDSISTKLRWADTFQWLVGFAVIVPVFFQLGRGIYSCAFNDPGYDMKWTLSLLPLPISLFVCFPAILLFQAFKRNRGLPAIIFAMFGVMLCGTVAAAGDQMAVKDKILLSLQYILPYWGLVLGEYADILGDFSAKLGKIFLMVVALVISTQVGIALYRGYHIVQPNLVLFSIYNNLQYAPQVLMSGFVLAVFSVYQVRRPLVLALTPVMFLYAGMSWSISTCLLLFSGLLLYSVFYRPGKYFYISVLLGLAIFAGYGISLRQTDMTYKFKFLAPVEQETFTAADATGAAEPGRIGKSSVFRFLPNLGQRFGVWSYYGRAILDSDMKSLLLGQGSVPDRDKFPSAHNYYLDMLYNWGIFPVLLLFYLLAYTIRAAWKSRAMVIRSPAITGLIFVVFFLVLIDNSLKVGLRQPYPGIYTFFLWGFLISRLKNLDSSRARSALVPEMGRAPH